jgi:hypothetical protein
LIEGEFTKDAGVFIYDGIPIWNQEDENMKQLEVFL